MTDPLSALSATFRDPVERALLRSPDLLMLVRRNRSAGSRDWLLVRNLADLDLAAAQAGTSGCLTVFLEGQLAHRGQASPRLLAAALEVLRASDETLIAVVPDAGPFLVDALEVTSDDRADLLVWFAAHGGRRIAFGPYPPFDSTDRAVAIDGYLPAPDGSIVRGIY